ncbi:MAG: hypothetical protein JWM39_270 [Parcubacteria group bacterium]|nr:hypothetical protein [Parcubacteria group bacterium]
MRSPRLGFTLIELLVVIAIIGILSSIVLSSLNTARNKGNDAAIKSNLDQARTGAELFYDSNNNHYVTAAGAATDVCSSTGTAGGINSIYKSVLAAAQAAGLSSVDTTLLVLSPIGNAVCHSCYPGEAGSDCGTADRWAAQVPLKSAPGVVWCEDSSGSVGTSTNTLASGDTHCN